MADYYILLPPKIRTICRRLKDDDEELSRLDLDWENVTRAGDFCAMCVAKCLPNNTNLIDMAVSNTIVGDKGLSAIFKGLKQNTSVCTLEVYRNPIGSNAVVDLSDMLKVNQTLMCLKLCGSRIGDKQAIALAKGLEHNCSLKKLDLHDNYIGNIGADAIFKSLKRNSSVTVINISSNPVRDGVKTGLVDLLKVSQTLVSLHLCNTKLGDSQVIALADGLAHNRSLCCLFLGQNFIGDNGAIALFAALESNRMEHLHLHSNKIGVEGVRKVANVLSHNESHEGISVGDNPYGREGLALIAKSMESNMTLKYLWITSGKGREEATINFFTELNRAGRKLLQIEKAPLGLWAQVLANAGKRGKCRSRFAPDMVHYFLREKPSICAPRLPRQGGSTGMNSTI